MVVSHPLAPLDVRDSSFVPFRTPTTSPSRSLSQRRAVPSAALPPLRGSHLAALFSVSIVAGPSLSPVDVIRSTGTRSHSPLEPEAEMLEARLLALSTLVRPLERNPGKLRASSRLKRSMHRLASNYNVVTD